jgi:hypothetical protein
MDVEWGIEWRGGDDGEGSEMEWDGTDTRVHRGPEEGDADVDRRRRKLYQQHVPTTSYSNK